jgi:molybdopterin synthase sulfur carrier subunit
VGETPVTAASVRVRYWAAAKAAAGTAEDMLPAIGRLTLADVRRQAVALHQGTRLEQVLDACSVLVGDTPVGSRPDDEVLIQPGTSVEFLPPFAGG